MKPRQLNSDEVTFRIKLRPCDLDVFEELSECYDSREDIQAMLDACGEWGWTDVEVVATWGIWSASDYLGGCSYRDEEDFVGNGGEVTGGDGYFHDMKETALANLNDQIANAYRTFDSLMVSK